MTALNNFDAVSVCCLSLRKSMNLRRKRCSFEQKRNSPCKDIKSSIEKRKSSKHSENAKQSSKRLQKNTVKIKKSVSDDLLTVKSPDINLITSTPIPHEIRRTLSRTSNRCNSNEISKLNSLNKVSCSIISSPIHNTSFKIKPCEVKLSPLRSPGKIYSRRKNCGLTLRSNKKLSNSHLSHSSLNSSIEALKGNVKSTRNSMTLQSQNARKKVLNEEISLSKKLRSARNISNTSEKKLTKFQKTTEKFDVPQNEMQLHNKKGIRKSLTSNDVKSVLDKSQMFLRKNSFDPEISQKSRSNLLQSFYETDNSKSFRYSLKNSLSVPENKSYCKNNCSVYSEKLVSQFSSTPKNSNSVFKKSNRISRRQADAVGVEISRQSEVSLTGSNSETGNFKSSRYNLRLQNQQLLSTASGNRLSSKDNMMYQDKTNTKKNLLKPSSDNAKRSRYSLRLSLNKSKSPKKTADSYLSLKISSKKTTSAKKNKKAENVSQNNTSEQYKKPTSISKKRKKSANKFQRKILNFTEGIPIDDLSLSSKCDKRKRKSGGFKLSGRNTVKRKISAIQAALKADEDYEDDLYESKKFDKFKELLMDTSDSEASFAISTPKFPVTPLIRHKTPKFKDCYSPTEYAASRKAAIEYMYRNKRRRSGQKSSETLALTEKKKLEYSQVLEDAQKIQKTIESLAEEESDNDSYFSFS